MRLRRVRLPEGGTGVAVLDDDRARWVPLVPALERHPEVTLDDEAARDVVAFLAGGERLRDAAHELIGKVRDDVPWVDLTPELPFRPALLRNYASWKEHWENAARGLTRRYLPSGFRAASAVEAVTRRTFPPFATGPLFAQEPTFYIGNHLTLLTEGEEVPWPSYAQDLDLELELAAVVVRPVRDVTPAEAEKAIGGFVLYDDFTARDEQWKQTRQGLLGPLGKAKSFASGLGVEVVTADEILPRVETLTGSVVVNGDVWSVTSTAGMQHSFGEMLAYAARSEQVHVGEVLSSGTLPRGAGVEIDRWLQPGDSATVSITGVGSLTNTIGKRPDA